MDDLNENHKRILLIRFQYVDNLLSEFESILDVIIPRSPLQQYVNDIDPDLRRLIENHCNLIRKTMCRILEENDIAVKKPERSLLHNIDTILSFADMSIEELRPKYIRGYGQLSEAAEDKLNAIATELQGLLKEIKSNLPEC